MYRIFHYVKYTTCHYISLHYITNILMIYTRSKGKPAGRCLQYSFPHPGHIKAPNFGRSTACWRSRYFESCQVASIRWCQWRPQLPETLYTVGYHGSGEMHVWKIMEVCCIQLYSHLDENKNLKQCQKNKTHFEQWNHCKYFERSRHSSNHSHSKFSKVITYLRPCVPFIHRALMIPGATKRLCLGALHGRSMRSSLRLDQPPKSDWKRTVTGLVHDIYWYMIYFKWPLTVGNAPNFVIYNVKWGLIIPPGLVKHHCLQKNM